MKTLFEIDHEAQHIYKRLDYYKNALLTATETNALCQMRFYRTAIIKLLEHVTDLASQAAYIKIQEQTHITTMDALCFFKVNFEVSNGLFFIKP